MAEELLTKDALNSLIKNMTVTEKWYQPLVKAMSDGAINTKNRVSAFVSQILHESNNLKSLEENLNYGAEGLMNTFKKYFPTLELAKKYERKPEMIANKVYGGRMGNNTAGDGWKYRGRGVIQLTGKDNYAQFQKDTGIKVLDNPDLLKQPEYALRSAVWFWNKNNLSPIADKGDFKAITQRINGGQTGAVDRESKYSKLISIVKDVGKKAGEAVDYTKEAVKAHPIITISITASALILSYIVYIKFIQKK